MSASRLRVGIAGLGRSGWNIHAKTVLGMPDQFEIAAVADKAEDRRVEAVAACGCRAYADFESLIENKNVDVVVVATPNFLHTAHAIAAMRAGKHVVCEKPFALATADADRMIEVADDTGRVVVGRG